MSSPSLLTNKQHTIIQKLLRSFTTLNNKTLEWLFFAEHKILIMFTVFELLLRDTDIYSNQKKLDVHAYRRYRDTTILFEEKYHRKKVLFLHKLFNYKKRNSFCQKLCFCISLYMCVCMGLSRAINFVNFFK